MKMFGYIIAMSLALCACSSEDDDELLVPQPDTTGTSESVINKVITSMTLNLNTNKVSYRPGETVTFTVEGELPSGASVRYRQGNNTIATSAVSGTSWTWKVPQTDFTGYMADIYTTGDGGIETIHGSIAVDVSSDWARFPRYGFVYDFDASKTESVIATEMAFLNRCHLNGIQFYDWHNKHHWPLGGTRNNLFTTYKDIANRNVVTSVVKNYITIQHRYGMKAMFYNLCLGALADAERDGVSPEWYLYSDRNHNVVDKHEMPAAWKSDVLLVDPGNSSWQDYLAQRNDDVYANFQFDGFHIDQLGTRGTRYDYNGNQLDLAQGYVSFLHAMKKAHPQKLLVMNSVSSFGTTEIAKSGQTEFLYNELWESEDKFTDLRDIVHSNRAASGGKNTVLAAYMNYNVGSGNFNIPGVLLTDAFIFAVGGAHLELSGDHMLCSEYFPNSTLLMSDLMKRQMIRYYDFLVAYENLLRDGQVEQTADVTSKQGGIVINAWPPKTGQITAYGTQVGGRQIVHLLNLLKAKSLSWRDIDGTVSLPQTIKELPLTMTVTGTIKKLWIATPDNFGGTALQLKFKQEGSTVSFTLPYLKYWTMIVAE